jgi:peptidoglycan/xylan/chitin deacetylase (PgdA/CDA1 family)
MTPPGTLNRMLHRTPRHPHAWLWLALALHLGVAGVWWRWGWMPGLAGLFAVHMLFLWGTMRPQSRLFGPVLSRLPITENAVWLTVDDGPSHETEALLDLLDQHAAKATFFLVADRATARPWLAR